MRIPCALGLLVYFLVPVSGRTAGLADASLARSLPVYDLEIRLRPEARRMEVQGQVTLPATSAPREELRLVLSAQMRNFRVQVVAPRGCAGEARLETRSMAQLQTDDGHTWTLEVFHIDDVPPSGKAYFDVLTGIP
jgi:hypothetical protein